MARQLERLGQQFTTLAKNAGVSSGLAAAFSSSAALPSETSVSLALRRLQHSLASTSSASASGARLQQGQRAWSSLEQAMKACTGAHASAAAGRLPMLAWQATASGARAAGSGSIRSMLMHRLKSTVAAETANAAKAGAEAAATAAAAASVEAPLIGSRALTAGLSSSARNQLFWWLGGTAVWVYSMVVLGGVTRLTRSGLSMTEWKFTGEKTPITQADWEAEFEKYKASPEFKKVHSRMTLEEFKFIFWMEYGHRMWGRLLGFAFIVPGAYFAARGYINRALAKRLGVLFAMGGTQGLVGWWMVRSGLVEPEHDWQTPRVSPYRLAAHLVSAFTIFATLVWTALDVRNPVPLMANAAEGVTAAATKLARGRLLPFAALVAVTATSGAFVAGMDAGRAYNTWPLMDGGIVPEEYFAERTPGLRNFFENTAAVQFDHRLLATTTAVSALALFPWIKSLPVPAAAKTCMHVVAGVTVAQFALGVWTLLEYVPAHLGSMHQANALNLFTAVLATLHALRPAQPGPISTAAARFGAPAAVAAVAAIGLKVTSQY